ncbi:MAG: thiamine pyrophosphate-dependent enzyme [Acidimicrobiales bacterium]
MSTSGPGGGHAASPAQPVAAFKPELLQSSEHELCPGCGHPVAWRLVLEALADLGLSKRTVLIAGHGCYTQMMKLSDLDSLQCLHGRAPAVATGVKRMLPDTAVLTLQGDGDMVSEGLHEVLHAGARGERVTALLLNNGVFGDTGGHLTATTVLGQRTKTSLEGRDPEVHGHPIDVARLLAQLDGTAYVARGAVNTAGLVARTARMIRRALELQMAGAGFTFVEVLTMCPTGWFVPTADGPDYLEESIMATFGIGELKVPGTPEAP